MKNPRLEINVQKEIKEYLYHFCSVEDLKGTAVNRTSPSLNGDFN